MAYLLASNALTAIRECLDDGNGSLRTIASNRFRDSLPEQHSEQELQRRGITASKPFRVSCKSCVPHPDSPGIMGSILLYEATFTITVSRTVSQKQQTSADHMAALEALAMEDCDVIRQALCTPPNLSQTSAGASTDISGGCLSFQRSNARLVSSGNPPAVAQRYETEHQFSGVLISRPATA